MEKLMSQGKFQRFIVEQFTHMHEEMSSLKVEMRSGFAELREESVEIKGILYPLAKAFDSDTQKVADHEKRLVRVENKVGLYNKE